MSPYGFPERPQMDALGFDRRLMTPDRLLTLAGAVPLQLSEQGVPSLSLDCARCGKAVEVLTGSSGDTYRITAGQLLAAVLRHQVMRHGVPLSGGSNERDGSTGDGRGQCAPHRQDHGGGGDHPDPGLAGTGVH